MSDTTKRFDGTFLVWRKTTGQNLNPKVGGRRIPHFRHETFEAAEREANRLLGEYPESTFVIIQEVATVKARAEQVAA